MLTVFALSADKGEGRRITEFETHVQCINNYENVLQSVTGTVYHVDKTQSRILFDLHQQ